ncbi:hypothetical protein [Xanthomonas sp. SI]|uniref:hypothetical protein n=1 Tax=Xanthomonas sp. SI TaxID=2724123 RepID=UPI001639C94C|nr:hypothetical protein [Xanthomonas sp. SI]QNH12146.1 hypothetical protein HEP75_01569 [Xanthomonas sp. SI]
MPALPIQGRNSFLEFLRNLTPQVLLVSASIFMADIYTTHPGSIKGWLAAILGVLLLAILLVAMLSNMWQFMDNIAWHGAAEPAECAGTYPADESGPADGKRLGRIWRKLKKIVITDWRKSIARLAAIMVIYAALIAVLITSARNTLKAIT